MSSVERFNTLYQTHRDAAQKCAALSLEGAERLFNLQMDTAQDMIAKGSSQFKELCSWMDPSQSTADWPSFVERNVRKGMEMTRTYLETVTKLQTEFSHIVEWQAPVIGRSMVDAIQAFGAEGVPEPAAGRHASDMEEHKTRRAA